MASSRDSRHKFITSLKAFLREHNFDGVDIDWCVPAFARSVRFVHVGGPHLRIPRLRFPPQRSRRISCLVREFPCSKARTNYVKYSCWNIEPVEDQGGNCPEDTVNFVVLMREVREALGDAYISIASPASDLFYNDMDLAALAAHVDHFNVMTYDFTVPATETSTHTAPHAPLYNPGAAVAGDAAGWSVDTAIQHYLSHGVDACHAQR